MNKTKLVIMIIFTLLITTSCQTQEDEIVVKENPVKTTILKSESKETILSYYGNVVPESIYKKSFPSDGIINSITVKKGDSISVGQTLATIDSIVEGSPVNIPLISDIDGFVLDILQKEGEMIGAAYPSLILRGKELVVKFGLSSNDKSNVKVGDSAFLILNGKRINSNIKLISPSPDVATNSYETEIAFPDNFDTGTSDLNIGDLIEVGIVSGKSSGIWININYILSDGIDYVYVVKDGRALKKPVEILSLEDDMVRIDGLNEGDELIVSGFSSISDGQKIRVVDDENSNNPKESSEESKNE